MTDLVQNLVDLLDIEKLELDLFRGISPDNEVSVRVFGGQVIAQALVAAHRTVDTSARTCHSLHAYFIRPGDPSIPIIYEVDRARDGGSFTTRRVVAIQHGKQIFNLAASFQKSEESWSHQGEMPDVPPPSELEDRLTRWRAFEDQVPERLRRVLLRDSAIEIRDVNPRNPLTPQALDPQRAIWFRLTAQIDQPPWVHQCLLAYASDMSLLGTGNLPHGINYFSEELMSASLDHALWFHNPLRFDEWHLYSMDSPFAGGSRSFNRGSIFAQDGTLVASVAQEGLMRRIQPKR